MRKTPRSKKRATKGSFFARNDSGTPCAEQGLDPWQVRFAAGIVFLARFILLPAKSLDFGGGWT
jgi:hypothetical protein